MLNLVKNILTHFTRKRKIQIFSLIILMILSSLIELASIGTIIPFISVLAAPEKLYNMDFFHNLFLYYNYNNSNEIIIPITILFITLTIFSGIVRWFLMWVQINLSYALGTDISKKMFNKTLKQPYTFHLDNNTSKLITTISGKSKTLITGIFNPLLIAISNSIILISLLLIIVKLEPYIALISLLFFTIIYSIILYLTRNKIKHYGKIQNKQQVLVLKNLQESFGSIKDIILANTQLIHTKIYENNESKFRKSLANIEFISNSPRFVLEILGYISVALIAFILTKNNGITNALPMLGIMAISAQKLLPSFQNVYSSFILIQSNKPSLIDILELLNQSNDKNENFLNKKHFNSFKFLNLKNIFFKYSENQNYILKNINLSIENGSRTGIIGSTGSGKTTLLDLIMGLLLPFSGKMYIDNVEISKENIYSWRSIVAHVPQSIYLSDSTILENIAFGEEVSDIDLNKVIRVSKQAQIAEYIEQLEKGYNTIVGERGTRLSGGQRQRIGIARALYKDAKIIIFDEATSALDTDTETKLMNSIYELDKNITIIIIAHRKSTLKNCNIIIELDKGEIKNIGSYNDLISKN